MHYAFAPLEGITTFVFRRAHRRLFGGADQYYMPFVSPASEHLFTQKELRELAPEHNAGVPAVPQVMTRSAADFIWIAGQLRDMGYGEINLNLGCPSGTVTAKGKGAGFLAHPDELDRFLETVFSAVPGPISVKTRLGIRDPGEFPRLLAVYNRYPLTKLILHPRVQKDFYKLPVRLDAFAAALPESRNRVCYNGDLVTAADCRRFSAAFPTVQELMLGRGAIADPALLRKLCGGPPADRETLQAFTQTLYQDYRAAYGHPGGAAQRMKELWFYLIHLFDGGERYGKRMRRVSRPQEYELLEAGIFRDLPLRQEAQGPLI